MAKPIVTLTTDFGLADQYVGVMKGVILGICPDAQIVDISHDVTPHEIGEGGYIISQSWKYFPRKTVHVVVVDPGVGSLRRPILVEAGGHRFVAPDNGVLAPVYMAEEPKARLIANDRYFLKPVSRTFHGRDIFAPVAAHLAAGVPAARFGKLIEDYLRPTSEKPHRCGKHTWMGKVLKLDRFGNIVTSFHVNDFPDLDRRDFTVSVGPVQTSIFARNYTETSPGELFVILGSGGYYELSISQGNAARHIKCGIGGPVELVSY
jgi:S-adenosyl-L-methionine hydrolase (adenosine-forming)